LKSGVESNAVCAVTAAQIVVQKQRLLKETRGFRAVEKEAGFWANARSVHCWFADSLILRWFDQRQSNGRMCLMEEAVKRHGPSWIT
jgi:hypothetical protein